MTTGDDERSRLQAERDETINQALETLRTAAGRAPTDEERAAWAGSIRDALLDMKEPLQSSFSETHETIFRDVLEQDDGLIREVEQLRVGDEKVLKDLEALIEQSEAAIRDSAPQASDTDLNFPRLQQQVLAFEETVTTHRQAVTNCLQEAFVRDRGFID